MQEQGSNTAILVFIRNDYEEARRKWFSDQAGYKGNLSIIRLLNQHVERLARQTNLPYFIISGKEQSGSSFGERLTHAIQSVFERGFQHVIAIGNDCLELTKQHLIDAEKALAKKAMVLGPTQNGGAYLIGLSKATFQKEQFEILPWQRAGLLKALCEIAPDDNALVLLNAATDIDAKSTFSQQLKRLSLGWLKAKLLQIFWAFFKQAIPVFPSFLLTLIYVENTLRGPPTN